jgi:putative toxin-antitoxin system antitoxin component (TIGR02293 family)
MGNAALAEMLGYDEEHETTVEIVEHGLPYDAVERLAGSLDLTIEKMCQIIPVSRRTLARYRGGTLDSYVSDHILMIATVYERAVDVLESPENALVWL